MNCVYNNISIQSINNALKFMYNNCFKATKAAPMTKNETNHLVQLVAANKIINNKKTNATNNKLKEEAWQTLTNDFNSSLTSMPRTVCQLRLKWENLKKAARKRSSNMRNTLKTKGGKGHSSSDELLDKVTFLMDSTSQDFSVDFGEDATIKPNLRIAKKNEKLEDEECIAADQKDWLEEEKCFTAKQEMLEDGESFKTEQQDRLEEEEHFTIKQQDRLQKEECCRAKRKHWLDEEKCRAQILKENAFTEYLIAKKKKIDIEIERKDLIIAKLKLDLENSRLENLKLKRHLSYLEK